MSSLRKLGWPSFLLCLALASLYMADASWTSVTQHRSTYALEANFEAGPAIASDVVAVVLDGLRTDAVEGLPAFGRLARQGASGNMTVTVPSLSNPARAAFATGARPEVSGVTNNSTFEPVPVQSLFGLAARQGLRSSVFGSRFWPRAFGDSIDRIAPASRNASYAVDELVRWQAEHCDEALEYLAGSDAEIRVVDLQAGDEAGHTYGGDSDAYREVLVAVDACLGRIADQLRPQVTLLAFSDHGHIHRRGQGGHGGLEPEVMSAPFVLAGPGVRTAGQIEAQIVDLAPTISTLLGLPIPANSEGRVLWEALDVPADHEADLRRLEEEQRGALTAHMPDREAALQAQRSERLPRMLLIQCLLWAAILGAGYQLRHHFKGALIALASFFIAYFGLFYAFGLGYSISAIVRQEYLYSYLAKDVAAAAIAFGFAALVLFRFEGRSTTAAIRLAVLISAAAAALVSWTDYAHGLRMQGWMVELGPAFAAYLHMLAIVGVTVGILLVAVVNRFVAAGQESAQ